MQILKNLHVFLWESMTANNCNTYLIDGPTRVLIDPGHLKMFDHVEKGLSDLGLKIEDIGLVICTHAHPDHIEAAQLFTKTKARLSLHEAEWQLLKRMEGQIAATFGVRLDSISPDFFLKEGTLSVNGLELEIFHTPGHSPGSVCVYWPQHKVLFSGDLVFKEGLGRTDLPGGNGTLLKASIKKMAGLHTKWLLSGHGNMISGEKEVKSNFNEIETFWFKYL